MAELPSGTVTFLLTDVEGSTALWEEAPEAMRAALARHDALLRAAILEHGGHVVKTTGDGFHAAFARAPDAVAAALAAQRRLLAEPWGEVGPVRVRMALHTGVAEERDGDYYGPVLNRVARLLATGHGGQVLVSDATAGLVRDALPDGVGLLDLGEHRLKDLTRPERIFQLAAHDLPAGFSPLRTLDAHPNNLPAHPTALLGRERELAEVRGLFEDGARLVTLTGPGGTGKTRLGLQVGGNLVDDFEHGVFLVELAPISDPALMPSTIAQVIGVRDVGSRPIVDTLKEYLRARSVLLVLDNFEQILPASSIVADLLAACPGLAVLATSREPLRLRGEHEYAVPPLALPDATHQAAPETLAQYAAVALFLERAVAIRADFAVTAENAPAVVEVCARLDGLPLAIELAAARVRMLTPEAMVGRLGRRLPLLTGGARDLPTRQQTLRGTIAWSYDLLDDPERCLFRRLSVFIGGWSLAAADAVCNLGDLDVDVLDDLGSLASKSLIRRSEDSDGEPRFGMLETIREFALERLEESGEGARVRRRHARHYLEVAERAEPELRGAEQGAWLHRLEAEHGNMRAALQLQVEGGEAEMGLRLGGALSHFWEVRGYHTEGRARLADVLQLAGTRVDPKLRAKVLCELGFLAADQGEYAGARSLQEESLAMMRELGDRRGIARCLTGLAWIAIDEGDFATARDLHAESLAIGRDLGDRRGIALGLAGLGRIAAVQGDWATARTYHEEGLAIVRELGDMRNIARLLMHLGWVAIEQQDPAGAQERLAESLAIADELGDSRSLIDGLELSAYLALALGRMDRAARLRGAAEAYREAIDVPPSPTERASDDIDIAAIRAALGEPGFAAAWVVGRAMTLEQAVAYALDEQPSA